MRPWYIIKVAHKTATRVYVILPMNANHDPSNTVPEIILQFRQAGGAHEY